MSSGLATISLIKSFLWRKKSLIENTDPAPVEKTVVFEVTFDRKMHTNTIKTGRERYGTHPVYPVYLLAGFCGKSCSKRTSSLGDLPNDDLR